MNKIVLFGNPVAQARVRVFKRGNKVMTFDPQSSLKRELKKEVMEQWYNLPKLLYPRVSFWFFMPIPKSLPREDRKLADEGYLKHLKKPDVDNLIKLYLDVLSGIAFEDDNCVSLGQSIKVYSQTPKVRIYIEETDRIINTQEILNEAVCPKIPKP